MRRSPRRSLRGFTLVELMVSLVAGLIIAIAVVGLAKAATTTFHEQARLSAVEGAVRSASERLRADLARVSFMSTGNIRLASLDNSDPPVPFGMRVAHQVGNPTPRYPAIVDLQGIRVHVNGSVDNAVIPTAGTQGPNGLATVNSLKPDAITITGNLLTDDAYEGHWRGTGSCGGPRIELQRDADPAVRRLLNTATPDAAVKAAFTPDPARDFVARLVDSRNCQHFIPVCAAQAPDATKAYIDLRPAADGVAILPPTNQAGSPGAEGCGGTESERFMISPVHQVRWYLGPNTDAILATDPNIEPAGNKFNLYREMLDAAGAPLAGREIVAEYAVDLKFGIVIDHPDPTVLPPNKVQVFDMDTDPGAGNVATWTKAASTTASKGPGPQRVRSVRFRLATRAPVPDRAANLIVPPGAPYMARYCIEAGLATCKRFARVRTLVSEVALINQAGMTY